MERIPKPKHGSKEWLLSRWRDDLGRCVFGASDIPALMNASPYKTRAELFADKLNEPVEQAESAIFRRGNLSRSRCSKQHQMNWVGRSLRLRRSIEMADCRCRLTE